jgi:hypothetical protein
MAKVTSYFWTRARYAKRAQAGSGPSLCNYLISCAVLEVTHVISAGDADHYVIFITNSAYEKGIASPQGSGVYWLEGLTHAGWQQRNKKGRARPLLLGRRRIHETALKKGN